MSVVEYLCKCLLIECDCAAFLGISNRPSYEVCLRFVQQCNLIAVFRMKRKNGTTDACWAANTDDYPRP